MLFICSSIREGNRQRFWGTKHNWVNVVNDSCPFQFLCQNFFFINHWLMVRQWVSNSIHCILSRFTIYIRHQTYCCNWLTLKLMDTPYTSFVEKCHFWINRPAFLYLTEELTQIMQWKIIVNDVRRYLCGNWILRSNGFTIINTNNTVN